MACPCHDSSHPVARALRKARPPDSAGRPASRPTRAFQLPFSCHPLSYLLSSPRMTLRPLTFRLYTFIIRVSYTYLQASVLRPPIAFILTSSPICLVSPSKTTCLKRIHRRHINQLSISTHALLHFRMNNVHRPADSFMVLPGMKPVYTSDPKHPGETRLPGCTWLPNRVRHLIISMLGEFVGTYLFLFFAFSGTQVANTISANAGSPPNASTQLYIALAFGFSLCVNVWIFFRISGGLFNPAVGTTTLSLFAMSANRRE